MDDKRRLKTQISGMTGKQKAEYILAYYWYHILGICVFIALVIFLIVHFGFSGDKTRLSIVIVNQEVDYSRDDSLEEAIAEATDLSAEEIVVDSDYIISYTGHELKDINESSFEKLFIKWSNHEIDAIVMPTDFLEYCLTIGGEFYDVSDFEIYDLTEYNGTASGLKLDGTSWEDLWHEGTEGELVIVFPVEGDRIEEIQMFIDYLVTREN